MSTSSNLNNLGIEIEQALATIIPQIEGLHDFSRLNLKPETAEKVGAVTVDFERRKTLLDAAASALDALEKDGYPEVQTQEVVQDVYNDLADNVSTIEAAFSKFSAIPEAASASIKAGTPTLK